MGCRLSKSIIQAEKECYICRRWYAVKTTRGLEEHHVLNGPLRSFSETVSYTHLTLPTNSRV